MIYFWGTNYPHRSEKRRHNDYLSIIMHLIIYTCFIFRSGEAVAFVHARYCDHSRLDHCISLMMSVQEQWQTKQLSDMSIDTCTWCMTLKIWNTFISFELVFLIHYQFKFKLNHQSKMFWYMMELICIEQPRLRKQKLSFPGGF